MNALGILLSTLVHESHEDVVLQHTCAISEWNKQVLM